MTKGESEGLIFEGYLLSSEKEKSSVLPPCEWQGQSI